MKNYTKYFPWLLTLLFGVCVFVFFYVKYPNHFYYHEQFQLFLFTPNYFIDTISVPGGLADYIGRFLTQFYIFPWVGALILAFLLMGIQLVMAAVVKKDEYQEVSDGRMVYPLTFIPSLGLWAFLVDENAMLSAVVAVLCCLFCVRLVRKTTSEKVQVLIDILLIPFLYWAFGPIVWGYTLIRCADYLSARWKWMGAIVVLLTICAIMLSRLICAFPLSRLFGGLDYYRFPSIHPFILLAVVLLCVIVAVCGRYIASLKWRYTNVWMTVGFCVVLSVGYSFVFHRADFMKEEAMKYDYLVQTCQWNSIIQEAEQTIPTTPAAVTCLNLALSQTGQLPDRMFTFYQGGTEGLIPAYVRDFVLPLTTGEVYFHLGMVNTAQRFAFEAMEAIPDFQKSSRVYKRLAETNLINKQYDVARKYLNALMHTLFYRQWAADKLQLLGNERTINKHPVYGTLRQIRYTDDFLFSEDEMDQMLGLLLVHNKRNRMAFEYLLAYVMLKRDMQKFMTYYPMGKDMGYDHIPLSYQEALVFGWTQNHSSFQGMPWSIDEGVARRMSQFAQMYTSGNRNVSGLGNSFWYYLLLQK